MDDKAGEEIKRIEVELETVEQLFNSMDPSPFVARDLDGDAEEFIVNWASEYQKDEPVTLCIYLANWPGRDPSQMLAEAVHNFFDYRRKLSDREFRLLMQQGRTSLLIGLLFLVSCLFVVQAVLLPMKGPWPAILRESLTIAGWVAMWRPMQIFLYDWWPLLKRGQVYAKLSRMPVQVLRKTQSYRVVPQ